MLFPKLLKSSRPRRRPREFRLRDVVVSYEQMHAYITRRDGVCLAFRFDRRHSCRGRDGRIHSPDNVLKLTLEHVHDRGESAMGMKAASDEHHLVALCHRMNGGGDVASRDLREFCRDWIADRELSSDRGGDG